MVRKPKPTPKVIGWREWIALPELGIERIKAKVDTGARSSAIHAYDIEIEQDGNGIQVVRFKVHPFQRSTKVTVAAEVPLEDNRLIRSSTGHRTLRPTIITKVVMMGQEWPIELTLANRDSMGFRMLLGRQALRRRFIVDPSHSFLGEKNKTLIDRQSK